MGSLHMAAYSTSQPIVGVECAGMGADRNWTERSGILVFMFAAVTFRVIWKIHVSFT